MKTELKRVVTSSTTWVAVLLISFITSMLFNFRFYTESKEYIRLVEQINLEKRNLENRLIEAEKERVKDKEVAAISETLNEYFIEKLDQLDNILVETDKNSLQLIEWLTDNAYFYGDDKDLANYKYGNWKAVQKKTDQDYKALLNELKKFAEE